ncbi:MAG: alanine racemase [Lachnospiraceae bacterium]|jgi:UDP-N-acetylmuramoyl-tripeptide--D-alanyl-D-alanine ligase|nr:alanine racemase [Lachnospiraceae bacterium]
MEKLLYSEIANCLRKTDTSVTSDFFVTGVSTDSRTIAGGDLFVALVGANFDGHSFVALAEEKGAAAVVCSREVKANIPVIRVDDTLRAYQQLAAYYRTKFTIPIIAVTGSNGKTTAKNMIATVLAAKYKVLYTDKNFNNEIGLPKSVLQLDNSYDVAVFEMGMNHLGEIETLSRIAQPDIAVITNIGKAHIGNLGSQENILKAKMEITAGLKLGGLLVLNADDQYLGQVKSDGHTIEYIGTGTASDLALTATAIEAHVKPTRFTATSKEGESAVCSLPTLGKHNVSNALFALYCGLKLGVPLADAAAELRRYTASPMRTEIATIKGVTVIKDYYNSSPEAAAAAIDSLAEYPVNGKRIAILGEMYELGECSGDEHRKLGAACAEKGIDYLYFIGEHATAVKEGFGERGGEFYRENERAVLAKSLLGFVTNDTLNDGSVILIKGSRATKMEEFFELLKSYINAVRSDFTAMPPSPTRLYVDVGAIKFNYAQIKKAVGSQVEIMPMVKANAYGCGSEILANVFRDSKYLAVADIKEAALIRRILPEAGFVIIYQPPRRDIEEIIENGYIPAVSDADFARKLNDEALAQGKTVKIHIEVDTGMCRLGIKTDRAKNFAEELKELTNISVEGIFTHYACAESYTESDLAFTKEQTARFTQAVADAESVLGEIKYKHACAGAAIFNQKAAHFAMVRPGYMLYGYYPGEALREMVELKPALRFASIIIQIREVDEGVPIGYNRRYVTTRKTRLAAVAVGYSDGLFRSLYSPENAQNGAFVVNGQRAPILGNISMDLTIIDITDIAGQVAVGDEVDIFDNVNVTVEEMAKICRTIGYEIIAKIEDKADRVESF